MFGTQMFLFRNEITFTDPSFRSQLHMGEYRPFHIFCMFLTFYLRVMKIDHLNRIIWDWASGSWASARSHVNFCKGTHTHTQAFFYAFCILFPSPYVLSFHILLEKFVKSSFCGLKVTDFG